MKGERRRAKKYTKVQMRGSADRREAPRIVVDSSDPCCDSSDSDSNMDMEDSVDGMPVLRIVRWRPQSVHGRESKFVNPNQAKLLKSIRRKDTEGVKQQIKNLDEDDLTHAEDEYAVSFLEHAVRTGSTRIVDEFLSRCDSDKEKSSALNRALLFAIKDNDIKMAAHIVRIHRDAGFCKNTKVANGRASIRNSNISHDLKASAQVDDQNPTQSQPSSGDEHPPDGDQIELTNLSKAKRNVSLPRTVSTMLLLHDSEYSQEMTPIVMAAQLERTEIIRLLIDECCPDIHPITEIPSVDHDENHCYVCQERAEFIGIQPIESCRKAIEVYKALSSPAYMFQAGVEDPVLEAFYISDLMEKRKVVDPAFVDDYDAISKKCKKFATDLLGMCRTCSEVTALLQHNGGINHIHAAYHSVSYPRLMVAAYYNQKEFVAHPHCQQVLQNVWYQGLPAWVCSTKHHFTRVSAYVLLLALGLPFIMILYMFRIPFVDQLVRTPANKFLFDIITYTSFLVLLFTNDVFGGLHERSAKLTVIEILIFLWLMGHTLRFIRVTTRRRGIGCPTLNHRHDISNWKIYQLAPLVLFWIYFGLKLGLYGVAKTTGKEDSDTDRKTWPWYDPFLWSESVYALACTLSVVQLYTFFKVSSNLGPLQISLKSMAYDVLSFLVLFGVILSAFAIGLSSLYTGYGGYRRIDPYNPSDERMQSDAFSSLGRTYKTLFWDIFGYGEASVADVVVSNLNVTEIINNTRTIVPRGELMKHKLTEAMGYFLFGVYHISVVIVLINMLIAMMANSYNRIEVNALTEWRFGRTQLITSYMNEMGVLVPPFNILPFRYLLGLIIKKTPRCFRSKLSRNDLNSSAKQHTDVIETLSKRYWRRREALQRNSSEDGGGEPPPMATPSAGRAALREARTSKA